MNTITIIQRYILQSQSMSDKVKPIQLISFDQNRKLVVNADAIKWLASANQQKHIGVVTVVGKYRTGKSYILNRVLLNQNNGFQVGPTINACTKGLWVWPELIQNPNDPTIQYMVMDTQGLGSLQEGEQTDTKIFLMAMLLSSFFIYNSVGSIDEKAVQNLSLVINLSKLLQKGSQRQMQDIINCFPSFLWLVRDFSLRLEDQTGKVITPKEYLQNALKLQGGNSDMVVRKNSIRKQLVNFFRDRDCFMLIRPVDDQKKLQNMAQVKDSQLRPKFVELINQLRVKVLGNVKKKSFKGKPCSPSMFVELCQYFCDSINQGGLPEIESNWDLVCRAESSRIQKRLIEEYEKVLRKYEIISPDKVNFKQFEKQVEQKIQKSLKYFQKNALGEKTQKKRMLREKMQQLFAKLSKKICSSRNQVLGEVITNLNDEVQILVGQNQISNIFDIAQKYDSIIQKESVNANVEVVSYLYKKCYEGLKAASFTYFGNSLQNQNYERKLLTEKLGFYQTSLNRAQEDSSRKMQQSDQRERELRQNVFQLEMRAKEAFQQLHKAKIELQNLYSQTPIQ